MLSNTQVFSKTVHMVCSSDRCMSIVQEILQRRDQLRREGKVPASTHMADRPIFIWEPVPDLCTPEEQDKFFAAIRIVDVVSPNELELGMMFDRPGWAEEKEEDRELVRRILKSGIGPTGKGVLSIRAGKDGSYSYMQNQRIWLPAYHEPDPPKPSPVVDPTGAGNSYLGALAQGMVSGNREPVRAIEAIFAASDKGTLESWGEYRYIPIALIIATVAAGFVVEQIGVPRRISRSAQGKELWNGSEFIERIRLYTERLCCR